MQEREVFKDALPGRVRITKEDLNKYIGTAKCQGCSAMIRGTTPQKHSDACRGRTEEEMTGEAKLE